MPLPVDTSAVSFVAAGPPEQAVDFDTKAPKTDDAGKPVFNVHLFAVGADGRDVITVKVAGEPREIGGTRWLVICGEEDGLPPNPTIEARPGACPDRRRAPRPPSGCCAG